MTYTLYIGNKNYSSWSLRPWLLMKTAGIAFREERIPLYTPDSSERVRSISPTGKVPCLHDGKVVVWDSLAIAEYLAERHAHLWPTDPEARAWARSMCAEMHSGFASLRNEMGMNIRARVPSPNRSEALKADIDRVIELWTLTRTRFGTAGPMLFGRFTIADAFFAPVASRFQTYGVELSGVEGPAGEYQRVLLALPAMQEWAGEAQRETERIAAYDPPISSAETMSG